MNDVLVTSALVPLSTIFTLFFLTLGPIKIFGPFAKMTREKSDAEVRGIALHVFILSAVAVIGGGYVGVALLEKWNVSPPALTLAGGIIFFLVALNLVLEQYDSERSAPPALPPTPLGAAMRLTFPTVVTPYGIAAFIVLIANGASRAGSILGILTGILVLDYLAMIFARKIVAGVGAVVLQILGAVLGVVQIALAIEMILRALQQLGVLRV